MIQATFFNDAVTRFDPILRENLVYLFANGEIKIANKRFTNIKNDYSIIFNMNAEISLVNDDESIQSQAYNFMTINEILS